MSYVLAKQLSEGVYQYRPRKCPRNGDGCVQEGLVGSRAQFNGGGDSTFSSMAESSVAPCNNMIHAPLASEQEEGQDESRVNPEDAIPYDQLFVSTSVIVPSTQL